jgi:DNA-directed RNA polymerase subunit E'/Rpb7
MIANPYFTTKLSSTVILYPHQMNEKLYINLKKNLEEKVTNKCFNKFGFIVKIIEILTYGLPIIEAENIDSSAVFSINFSCKICLPMKNMQIICQIQQFNKLLLIGVNGPISVVITNTRINESIFFKDNNGNIKYKNAAGESSYLKAKDYIKVIIQTVKFFDGDEKITTIGFLNDMATEEEIQTYFEHIYEETSPVDYEEHISSATLP